MYKRILAALFLAFTLGALCPAPATATSASRTEFSYERRHRHRRHPQKKIIIRLPGNSE
jgi:hypothetical protein